MSKQAIHIFSLVFILAFIGGCSTAYNKTMEGPGIEKRDTAHLIAQMQTAIAEANEFIDSMKT